MAVTLVSAGAKLTGTTLTNLKAAVKAECANRRIYTGSVATYGGTSYDYTTPSTTNNKVLLEHYNKNATPLDKIDGKTTTIDPGQKAIAGASTSTAKPDINGLINRINDLSNATNHPLDANTLAKTGCAASCTGLCFNTCGTACSSACEGTCGTMCSLGCGNACAIASSCAGTCVAACAPTSCGSGCASSCTAVCSNGCDSTCLTNCDYAGCGSGCQFNCGTSCGGCPSTCTAACSNTES